MNTTRHSASRYPVTLVSTIIATGLVLTVLPGPGRAQSVLDRTPNIDGTWVGLPGQLQFNFLHRFTVGGAPARKVVNSPTFLLSAALPGRTMLGVRYASNSDVAFSVVNEWELLGRFNPVAEARGAPLDLAVTGAYNVAATSVDGELAIGRTMGPLRLLAVGRAFTKAYYETSRQAVGGGALLRFTRHVALGGDVVTLLDRKSTEKVAWSAALQLGIPTTPHTLSLQAANTTTATLEGASRGATETRYGFEFTIPLTLSRFFGSRSVSSPSAGPAPVNAAGEVLVSMTDRLRYEPGTVRVRVGQTVRWRNASSVVHTVTADPSLAVNATWVALPEGAAAFNSGNLDPGQEFTHRFDVPGRYVYFCIPHAPAGMVGTIIVTQ